MASTLNASTSSGLISSGDTSGVLALQTNSGTTALTIDTSQNVGIGTSSPASKLNVSNSANSATSITVTNTNGGASAVANAKFTNSASTHEFGALSAGYGGYGVLTAGSAYIYAGNNQALEFAVDNNYIAFGAGTGATERMRINSSGYVGIGATSITAKLQVAGTGETSAPSINGAKAATIYVNAAQNAADGGGAIEFGGQVGTTFAAWKGGLDDGTPNTVGYLAAYTRNATADTAMTERMRITSSGNLLVGATALPSSSVSGVGIRNPLIAYSIWSAGSTTSQIYQIGFINGNGLVGRIETNGTATNFVTSSDERLKTNIVDAPSALSSVGSIKVRSFDWVGDGKHQEFGLVAQEINTVAPEAVSQGLEEADMWGVDFGKLVPRLVKAIQELKAINDTQAETINALTARIVALEGQ